MASTAAAEAKRRAVAKASTEATRKAALQPKSPSNNMAAVATPKGYTGAQFGDAALDFIPGGRLVANTVETLKGNRVSPERMQAGYLGVLPLSGAIKAAQSARAIAQTGAATAKAGLDFKKAYNATNLTDFTKVDSHYATHPAYDSLYKQFGMVDATVPGVPGQSTARGVAKYTGETAARDLAIQKTALEAQKFWETNPADPLEIYGRLQGSDLVKQAELEGYLPNLLSIVRNRSSEQIAADIEKLMKKQGAAQAYLTSPITAPLRGRDVLNEALSAQGQGFSLASPIAASRKTVELMGALPGGARATALNALARHRSDLTTLGDDLLHPTDVPITSGRVFGPGTYFAQTPTLSNELFSNFGSNVYKMQNTPSSVLKTLTSKGYLDISDPRAADVVKSEWASSVVQDLINEGYIGLKHGDALTNWLVGTKGGPKLTPAKIVDTKDAKELSAIVARLIAEKKRIAKAVPQQPITWKPDAPRSFSGGVFADVEG